MQIVVTIPEYGGLAPHIARTLHTVSSVPSCMRPPEARERLAMLARDLRRAAEHVDDAIERIHVEPRLRLARHPDRPGRVAR